MVDDPPRTRGRLWLGVALVVAAGLLPMLWVTSVRLAAPSDGTGTYPHAPAWSADGVIVSAVAGAGNPLRAGDLVVAIDGVPLETWASGGAHRQFSVGDRLTYEVVRDGQRTPVAVTLGRYPLREVFAAAAVLLPYMSLMYLIPAFVVVRRPRDPAARTLFAMPVLLLLGSDLYPFRCQIIDVASGRLWPTTVSDIANTLLWGSLLHFFLVFPQRWPWLARRKSLVVLAYLLPFALYGAQLALALPGVNSELDRLRLTVAVSTPAANVYPFLVAVTAVVSYRIAPDPFARQRMRWISYAFGIAAASYVGLGRIPEWLLGHPLVGWDLQALFFLPFPVALGAAVARYRLFDIQIILRRSLVYGLVTTALMVSYLGMVAVLSWLFGASASLVPLLAAAMVALAVSPTRTYLRRSVSRLVYGDRDDPYEVLRQLGQRLESATSVESVLAHLVETLVRTLRLSYAAVEVTGLDIPASSYGRPLGTPRTIPLVHRGEQLGQLVLDPGPGREPFGARDNRLLEGLARQVGETAHNLLLTARLQRSLERTVTALEEERRRLRRDIHDGLGPTLASATMRLELARSLMRTDPDKAEEIFAGLAETQRQALGDVRRLIDGLRPPVLDQLGLRSALSELVGRMSGPVAVSLRVDDELEGLPAAVEVAAYHIVSEALTNVLRHAQAGRGTVRLWRYGDNLRIEVRDDGVGLPPTYRAGVGLNSIRERSTELGGSADIRGAGPGPGTVVSASLPLPPERGPH